MSSTVNIPSNYTFTLGGGLAISTAPINVTSKLTGSPAEPIATLVTGDPNKPVATLITGDANKPVTSLLKGDENSPITTTLQGNPQKPLATTLELLNLPRFTLTDIKDLSIPKIRIRMPNYTQLCFKLYGTEIFSFCLSGEGQTITEPYVPNAYERCEIDCCEPDTRPFPQTPRDNDNNPNNPSTPNTPGITVSNNPATPNTPGATFNPNVTNNPATPNNPGATNPATTNIAGAAGRKSKR